MSKKEQASDNQQTGNSSLGVVSFSLRDKFAVEAMNGMLSNSIDTNQGCKPYWMGSTQEIAEEAYKFADAMLKARSNES
jgi:hypothetical protein